MIKHSSQSNLRRKEVIWLTLTPRSQSVREAEIQVGTEAKTVVEHLLIGSLSGLLVLAFVDTQDRLLKDETGRSG